MISMSKPGPRLYLKALRSATDFDSALFDTERFTIGFIVQTITKTKRSKIALTP